MGAFGVGVRRTFGNNRRLRWVGHLLIAVAVITLLGVIFAPMRMRGSAPSLNGTMHVVYISINSLLILIAIGLSAFALKGGFRVYALTSLIVMFGFGAWAGTFAGDIEAGLPTPWAGAIERASVYTCLVWLVVFAISLVQRQHLTQLMRQLVVRWPSHLTHAPCRPGRFGDLSRGLRINHRAWPLVPGVTRRMSSRD